MPISSSRKPTAWGDVHVYLGLTGEGDAMASSFDDLGALSPDNFSIETADGTKYELKDLNGKTIDTLKQQPTVTINFGLIAPTEATRGKFWAQTEEGTGDNRKVKITSLIQNAKYSIKLANPAAVGSETFEAAKATIDMKLAYSADQGWSGTCSAELLWPDRTPSELFQFGVVSSAATGIALNKATTTIAVAGEETLQAILTPVGATSTVTWSSATPAKATVDNNGKVTGVAAGSAVITATANGHSASCTVTVSA